MTKRIIELALVAAIVGGVVALWHSTTQWSEFNCEEGRFSVMMPGTPSHNVENTSDFVLGTIPYHLYASVPWYSIQIGGQEYVVAYFDLPEKGLVGSFKIDGADRARIIEGAKTGFLKKLNGKLVKETDVVVAGRPGKEWVAEGKQEGVDVVVIARATMIDRRMWMLVFAHKPGDYTKHADAFFRSFRVH